MKIKAIVIGLFLAIFCMVGTSYAVVANGYYACNASIVGPNAGRVYVNLAGCTNEAGAPTAVGWVVLSQTAEDQMLATFLTAISLTKPVVANVSGTWVDPSGFTYSEVVGLQMAAQ